MVVRDWKSIPVPAHMKGLKKDPRGYPVPFNIAVDKEGNAAFKVNNDSINERCIKENLCPVCGGRLYDDTWCLGGIEAAFHPRGAFNDSPMHKECCVYALQVCPYLAYTAYKAGKGIGDLTPEDLGAQAFVDPTQVPDRLPFFVLCKIKSYRVSKQGFNRFIIPQKPYLEIEYWSEGVEITKGAALRLMKEPLTFIVP